MHVEIINLTQTHVLRINIGLLYESDTLINT